MKMNELLDFPPDEPKTLAAMANDTSVESLCKLHNDDVFVGLEIEMEETSNKFSSMSSVSPQLGSVLKGNAFPDPVMNVKFAVFNSLWSSHGDGSLRGENARELVFKKPLKGNNIQMALIALQTVVEAFGKKPLMSGRCATHVHLNVLDLSVVEYIMLVVLYTFAESALFSYSGHYRRTNIYCNPIYETGMLQELISSLVHGYMQTSSKPKSSALSGVVTQFLNSWPKYCSINLGNHKHTKGTAEIRHFPATYSAEKLNTWVDLLMCLVTASKKLSKKYTFTSLVEDMMHDPTAVAKQIFGDLYPRLMEHATKSDLWDGARVLARVISSLSFTKTLNV